MRHAERSIAYFARFLAEDRAEKSFFGRKFRFALRGNFTHQNIAALHFRADAHDAVLVQIFQRVVAHVGNIARDFFGTELRISRFGFVLFDMDGSEHVVLHQFFGKQNGVLVVVAFPFHVADENIFTEGKFAVVRGGTVGNDFAFRHSVARRNDRALIQAGALVGTFEFLQRIFVNRAVILAHLNHVGCATHYHAGFFRAHHNAGIARNRGFDAGCHNGRFRL